jgi:protein-S-isoprenylcysteine O-methyltransferase Ste14
MEYRYTQIGKIIIAAVGITVGVALFLFWMDGALHPIAVVVIILLLFVLSQFHSLTVEIKDNNLVCRFGHGLIRKRISLSDVNEVRLVRNPWYAGWGIRWIPGRYWLWNISGVRAVELVLKDGKRFRIGTDEPELLVKAIQSNKIMLI